MTEQQERLAAELERLGLLAAMETVAAMATLQKMEKVAWAVFEDLPDFPQDGSVSAEEWVESDAFAVKKRAYESHSMLWTAYTALRDYVLLATRNDPECRDWRLVKAEVERHTG